MGVWREYKNNPLGKSVGDCAVRAISAALNTDWETAYALLCATGYRLGDLPNADAVWGTLLKEHGFQREIIPNSCPECYTFEDFCREHQKGIYVLGTGNHVATVKNGGQLFDSWDSSKEVPVFYWRKEE